MGLSPGYPALPLEGWRWVVGLAGRKQSAEGQVHHRTRSFKTESVNDSSTKFRWFASLTTHQDELIGSYAPLKPWKLAQGGSNTMPVTCMVAAFRGSGSCRSPSPGHEFSKMPCLPIWKRAPSCALSIAWKQSRRSHARPIGKVDELRIANLAATRP